MGALPLPERSDVLSRSQKELPDYLLARMVNEFAYCPRLFFYEWVEGLFAESADTVEGKIQHERVDEKSTALPEALDLPETIRARSVSLASERLRVIAKMDLVEAEGGTVTPVDYKHGYPREGPNGLELWPSDRAQLAVQGIVLRRTDTAAKKELCFTARPASGSASSLTKR
jgi:CRISPR/Cas system-associated exonuclease Cas4 (RecB family)